MRKHISAAILAIWLFSFIIPLRSQTLPSLVQELCGARWEGHYQNSEDSSILHVLRWSVLLDGRAAKSVKSVPELDFFMETNIYYDYEKDCLAFLSLLNKDMISKGTITVDQNRMKLIGTTTYKGGISAFRLEYFLNDKGQLEDRFFRKSKDGKWRQGHFILYERGEVRTANMVFVEGGGFTMGDIFGDGRENEQPLHKVSLPSFYAGQYEVSVGEFRRFVSSTGYISTAEKTGDARVWKAGIGTISDSLAYWDKPGHYQTDRHPVVLVSWYDAVAYCNWKSISEGLEPCYSIDGDNTICDFSKNGYRLLTEAEWEYIARDGGKEIKYSWGNGLPYIDGKPAANIRDEALGMASSTKEIQAGYDDGYIYSSPVGSFEPNGLGIYDLGGNVYEWCWDWFQDDYYAESPAEFPVCGTPSDMRSCRDVGFICYDISRRVISRGKGKPTLTFSWGGFRLARSISDRVPAGM
jgi:formylglycine-generating enzyme required for sulfatase activity